MGVLMTGIGLIKIVEWCRKMIEYFLWKYGIYILIIWAIFD